jgi:hypothetical protein
LVRLRESLDAFVLGERAAHHPLSPPILDDSLQRAGTGMSVRQGEASIPATSAHIRISIRCREKNPERGR